MKQVVPILIAALIGFTAGYILNSSKGSNNSSSDSVQDDQIAKLQKELKESEARAGKVDTIKEQSAKIIEAAIRNAAGKSTGELTEADYEKVTELDFYRNQLTYLKGLEKLTKLETLKLHANHLTDVKGLEKLTQLTELALAYNNLPEVPKELEKLTQLTVLHLRNCGLTSVKGLENLTQLTLLHLFRNQLTSVKGLEKLTKLEFLDLRDNPDLTKAQIDQLQKALPKCHIRSDFE